MTNQQEFTLIPAIFTPFSGFPSSGTRSGGRAEKLRKIHENLDVQHEAVRRNMMALLEIEKLRILGELEKKLREEELEDVETEVLKLDEAEVEAIIVRLRANTSTRSGVRYKEDDWMAGWGGKEGEGEGEMGGARDVEMGGIDGEPGARVRELKEATNSRLMELVVKAEEELRAYDAHAQKNREFYRKASPGATNKGFEAEGEVVGGFV